MGNYLHISDNFAKFVAWIGGSCKPSDKGKLTPLPRFSFCQHNFNNVSSMLRFEELPEVNSARWLNLEDLEGEIWKPVVGYEEEFAISNYGRIKSLPRLTRKTERIIKPYIGPRGYYEVNIYNGKKRIHRKVHRLLAITFIPNLENKTSIDHIDTNRLNNTLANIRWATCKENTNNKKSLPRILDALEKAHKSRQKKVAQKDLDGNIINVFDSITKASNATGINKCAIGQCARKRVAYTKEGWLVRNQTAGGFKWDFI